MDKLLSTFCRYDMVCDAPKSGGVEILHMPEFFVAGSALETKRAHVHNFYEIIWFQQGEGLHTVDFTDYPVLPNTFFFIAPGQIHYFPGINYKGVLIKVCSHILEDDISPEGVLIRHNFFNTYDSVPYCTVNPSATPALSAILAQIEEENVNSSIIGHHAYMQSLVKMLLINIERARTDGDDTLPSVSRTAHRAFLAFRREIEKQFRTHHTVKQYSNLLNISTRTLTNYVSECSTYSPLEMINNRIVLEAKRLLRYSDMMIKEISFELGFDDMSYFVKFFKRLAGLSPVQYRKSVELGTEQPAPGKALLGQGKDFTKIVQ